MTDLNPNIETALEAAILNGRRAREPREHFWASSVGMCPRKQIAERAGLAPTNPPDSRSHFKMMAGSVIGKEIQRLLESTGYLSPDWHEKHVTYRSYVGRVDGYTDRIPGGAIVELKTSDDRSILKYQDTPEHYLWQGYLYCLATGVDTLLLFQVGKNQGISRHRVLRIDSQWRKSLETHIDMMERFWARFVEQGGTLAALPDHLHNFGWEAKLCSMNESKPTQEVTDALDSPG